MKLKDFKLHHETDTHYTIQHPNGKTLSVEKSKLHEKAHELIKPLKMAEGGEVNASTNYDPNSAANNFGAGMEPGMPSETPAAPQVTQAPPPPSPEAPVNPAQGQGNVAEAIGESAQALENQKALNSAQGSVAAQLGETEKNAISDVQSKVEKMPTQQDIVNTYKAKDQALLDAYNSKKIDPDRYYKNMSTGAKVASAIGMLLSGFGGGASKQGNMAANILQKSVDDDIEAQKLDQGKAMNLWKMNKEAMGSDLAANLATQNQLYTGLKFKLEKAAAQFKGPQAALAAAQMNTVLDQKIAENHLKLAAMNPTAGANGKLSNQDPASAVPILVPPDRQKEVFGEIQAAQDTKRMGGSILDSFEKAVKENTVLKTGAGLLRTPGSVYALHQAMQPTFKDLEGTVRQAAMDNTFKNITPQPGDSDHTIATKRAALQDYLKSKISAPTAKGFGIDLKHYESTAPGETTEMKTMGGVQYKKVPGGWKKVQ